MTRRYSDSRVVLVTGGARGIGLATGRRFLAQGMRVALLDVARQILDEAGADLDEFKDRVILQTASVTDRGQVAMVLDYVLTRWGRLDILVNNAGINRSGGIFDQSETDWDAVINVNLKGTFVASAVCAVPMRDQGWGRIVNVGSIGAAGLGASPAYAASKAGLVGLTKQMARELGQDGITANLVAPGVTTTEWVSRHLPEERRQQTAAATPTGRIGEPDDVAATIAFLASDDARHITGQVVSVSGGYWMP
jgi:NAD(P)-dependent dehydrogenase (short-subunit alcohol dehydrogenase family)